ncbi:hypothetical protein GCM10010873_00920 [Cypionkella aquatica]|uniref:Uncharacterized protein n=1 Tax=Cypionkella aquatica TaxID=1756042 RepID=A0AA37TYV6_9RHOB|nr:hypothetical protein [Cypionkella aquatica]GLS85119.1 hypothetical protein GCM10010873_00920 [Cypionkella aquatica]
MNPIWLIRMSRWARNPPPLWRVKLVLGVIALCFVLWGVEQFWGWPDWLSTNGKAKIR